MMRLDESLFEAITDREQEFQQFKKDVADGNIGGQFGYDWYEDMVDDAYSEAVSRYENVEIEPSIQSGRGGVFMWIDGEDCGEVIDFEKECEELYDRACESDTYEEFKDNVSGYISNLVDKGYENISKEDYSEENYLPKFDSKYFKKVMHMLKEAGLQLYGNFDLDAGVYKNYWGVIQPYFWATRDGFKPLNRSGVALKGDLDSIRTISDAKRYLQQLDWEYFDEYRANQFAEDDDLEESKSFGVKKRDIIKWLKEQQENPLTEFEFKLVVDEIWKSIQEEQKENGPYSSIEDADIFHLIDTFSLDDDSRIYDLCLKLLDLDEEDEDDTDDIDLGGWEEIKSKQVEASDGFMTDYTWYVKYNEDGSETHVMIFGDKDLYTPVNSEPDAEFDGEDVAREWFNAYNGFAEDDELEESIDSDEADLNESIDSDVKDYTIEYYDNISAAERRPTTIDDIERNYSIEVAAFPDDFSACVYALAIHDEADYEFNQEEYLEEFGYADALKTTADVITKLNDIDWGDGSIIICRITEGDRVIYDSGLDKDALITSTDLEEAIQPNIESEELKALAQKHNIKILDAMSNGDLRMEGAGADLMKFYQEAEKLGLWQVSPELYEKLEGFDQIEEFTSLAKKLGFETLHQMRAVMEVAHKLGKSELEFVQYLDKKFHGKVPDSLIDGLTDEVIDIGNVLGILDNDMYQKFDKTERKPGETITVAMRRAYDELLDLSKKLDIGELNMDTNPAYKEFYLQEKRPDENVLDAMRRYYKELIDSGFDPDNLNESIELAEEAMLNINKSEALDAIANAKQYIKENNFAAAKDALLYAAKIVSTPITEGAVKDLMIEVEEDGGLDNWKTKMLKELADMEDSLSYMKNYAPKEINAGGMFDSAEDLNKSINELEDAINQVKAKIDIMTK